MITETFELPTHWAHYLVNGDSDGYEDEDVTAIEAFEKDLVEKYGACWCVGVEDEISFRKYHDATQFGVLGCDVSTFTFDVTPE